MSGMRTDAEASYRLDRLEFENLVLRQERDKARAEKDRAIQILSGVHALLYPKHVTNPAGQVFRFNFPNPHDLLQALSDRIRAIPDQLLRDAANQTKEPQWPAKI